MPPLDQDRCCCIVKNADRRFDGWFVTAARRTGMYCRQSCPVITPKQTNVEFHHTAAPMQSQLPRAAPYSRPAGCW
ncbi:Ada metal-binding domain-containing protein [uncultured Ilumatobacter sp.]|uniref:Ada metal-binding domain-containing protein n=1 Tax=uncultured Ilumatobacter sp. TaxID=879968 RepID=UPI00374F45A9